MRRDMEAIRQILLALDDGKGHNSVEGMDPDVYRYHAHLLIERGYAKGSVLWSNDVGHSDVPANAYIQRLTWDGHDFIEATRSDTNWQKAKDLVKQAGKVVTMETLQVAVQRLFLSF